MTVALRAAPGTAVRVAFVAVVLSALMIVHWSGRYGVSWRLLTFTYQANVLGAVYYVGTLAWPGLGARVGLRGAVVLYVVLAGVVWNLLLTGHSLGYTPANVLLHIVAPVLAVADWLLARGGGARWWLPVAWLAYPAAYLVLALVVLNHLGRRAPYYFLDPATVGLPAVVGVVAGLAAGILLLGYALLAVARDTSANG